VLDLEAEQKFSKGVVTIKGFATIDNVCLINIEGTGMVGVPGELYVLLLLLLLLLGVHKQQQHGRMP
jgi:hypothetical protein